MPGIPWEKVRGMRNHLAHVYYDVDLQTLWLMVQDDLPDLIQAIRQFLARY